MSDQIHATLFGQLNLYYNNQKITLPASKTARKLLAYLLLHHYPQVRAVLVGYFWPDVSEAQARRHLSQALWQIRRCLPYDIFATTEMETITLIKNEHLSIDVVQFEEWVTPHIGPHPPTKQALTTLTQGLTLYQTDLLTDLYDDWVLAKRQQLQELYYKTLTRLIHLEKQAGLYEQALTHALKLTEADPLYEAAHREVMQLYVILNRPNAALKQFELCRQVLDDELALDPDPATLNLAYDIAAKNKSVTQISPAFIIPKAKPILTIGQQDVNLNLIGRTEEHRQLLVYLEAIFTTAHHPSTTLTTPNKPQGGVVLIEGEAGIGKTRLIEELAQDATWRGAVVLWGRTVAKQAATSFSLLVDALQSGISRLRASQLDMVVNRHQLGVIAQIIPSLKTWLPDLPDPGPVDDIQQQKRLIKAFYAFLSGWSTVTPLVLILEDLHEADSDTLMLLTELNAALAKQSILIIATYRHAEAHFNPHVWQYIQHFNKTTPNRHIHLAQLTLKTSRELIRTALNTTQTMPLFEERLYQDTLGNPLFILETLRSLYEAGALFQDKNGYWATHFDESTTDYTELLLPAVIEQVIKQRLSQIPADIQQILQIAAVLTTGYHLDLIVLSQLCNLAEHPLLIKLNALVRWRFLRETSQTYQFTHAKLQQVIYQQIPSIKRTSLHYKIAQTLETASPAQVQALAYHYSHGEAWHKATLYTVQAAEVSLAKYAYQTALEQYNQALIFLEKPHALSQEETTSLKFELCLAQCNLLHIMGNITQEETALNTLVELSKLLINPHHQAEALNRQASFLSQIQHQYHQARHIAQAALVLAQEHHLPAQQALALQTIGQTYIHLKQHQPALAHLHQALALWQAMPDATTQIVTLHYWLYQAYDDLGDTTGLSQSRTIFNHIELSTQSPLIGIQNNEILAATTVRETGDYKQAAIYILNNLNLIQHYKLSYYQINTLNKLGLYYLWNLNYHRAETTLNQALAANTDQVDITGLIYTLNLLTHLYRQTGHYQLAYSYAIKGLTHAQQLDMPPLLLTLYCNLGQLYLHQDDLTPAQTYFQKAKIIAPNIDFALGSSTLYLGLGQLACQQKDYPTARHYFNQALEAAIKAGQPARIALCHSYLAISYYHTQNLSLATEQSNQAVTLLEQTTGGENPQRIYWYHAQILQATKQDQLAATTLQKAQATLYAQLEAFPDKPWKDHFLHQHPLNQQILQANLSLPTHNKQIQLSLPKLSAPLGRSLQDNEYTNVTWTIHMPEDDKIKSKVRRRRQVLLRLLQEAQTQKAAPTIDHLAEAVNVSEKTIRTDLAALRKTGHETPTRGQRQ